MKLELEFAGSVIREVKVNGTDLEISFDHMVISSPDSSAAKLKTGSVTGRIRIGQYKGKKLPKKGTLSDGEIYGIPGKALNGKIPADFHFKKEVEVELSVENTDYTITGKSLSVEVDMSSLPDVYRH